MNSYHYSECPIGIYVHIPFCYSKCGYCDFYSITDLSQKKLVGYIDSLKEEIRIIAETYGNLNVQSIYLGGGTPSILNLECIENIWESLNTKYRINEDAEITMEANPDSIDLKYLREIRNIGINRLSIGVQSLVEEELKLLDRRHDSTQAIKAVREAREAGFENLSIDVMFGLPSQEIETAVSNVIEAEALGVDHLSLYGLIPEPGTPMREQFERGELPFPSGGDYAEMYLQSSAFLTGKGFRRYEISNFSRKDFECRHNLNYWNYGSYLGFGPSAHSALISCEKGEYRVKRFWNYKDLDRYIRRVKKNTTAVEDTEELDSDKIALERLLLRLRMEEGYRFASDDEYYRFMSFDDMKSRIDNLCDKRMLVLEPGKAIRCTDVGFVYADEIIAGISASLNI